MASICDVGRRVWVLLVTRCCQKSRAFVARLGFRGKRFNWQIHVGEIEFAIKLFCCTSQFYRSFEPFPTQIYVMEILDGRLWMEQHGMGNETSAGRCDRNGLTGSRSDILLWSVSFCRSSCWLLQFIIKPHTVTWHGLSWHCYEAAFC